MSSAFEHVGSQQTGELCHASGAGDPGHSYGFLRHHLFQMSLSCRDLKGTENGSRSVRFKGAEAKQRFGRYGLRSWLILIECPAMSSIYPQSPHILTHPLACRNVGDTSWLLQEHRWRDLKTRTWIFLQKRCYTGRSGIEEIVFDIFLQSFALALSSPSVLNSDRPSQEPQLVARLKQHHHRSNISRNTKHILKCPWPWEALCKPRWLRYAPCRLMHHGRLLTLRWYAGGCFSDQKRCL